ncbi:MAG: glycosyl hydrolase [Clostridiales bacterium]|nr:glycosyl hydrolase [Clostridiales bacterium]
MKTDQLYKSKLALLAMQRHSWEQGVAMQAFLEQGDDDVVIAMAKEAAYRSVQDGRVAIIGTSDALTDPCSAGEGLLYAANITGDPELHKAHKNLLKWALEDAPRNTDGIVYHIGSAPQFWVDSMYMLPPYLAVSGHYKEAMIQIRGYWNVLFNKDEKLMSHIWDDGKKEFVRKDFWGVGNGWTMAGLARVIDLLPKEMEEEKKELIAKARTLINSVSKYIREDGLAHDVLNDPSSFIEVNLPQMLSYTIYRGIKSKWLESEWKELADKCRNAAHSKMDAYGLIQDVCGAPYFISPGVAPEGQAFYLLMEAAASKL